MSQQWIVALVSLFLLGLLAVVARIIQNRRRSQRLWAVLSESLPGPLKVQIEKKRDLQFVSFQPSPEPFQKLEAELRTSVQRSTLIVRGKLAKRHLGELLWRRGHAPGRALRRSIDSGLWELRRIDLVDGEFAVRGTNTSALEHVFFDLQARFGPFLQRVSVQVEQEFEVEIELNISRLNETDLPALVATIRSLGRAALR